MWLPKKSSSKVRYIIEIGASLLSLVVMHFAFIFVHSFVDDSAPSAMFGYKIDRVLEWGENIYARIQGSAAVSEVFASHASERVDEIEHLTSLETEKSAPKYSKEKEALLQDTQRSMERSISALQKYVDQKRHDDLEMFTLAIFVESTAEDIVRRLSKIQETILITDQNDLDEVLRKLNTSVNTSMVIAAALDVNEDIAKEIKANTQERVENRKAAMLEDAETKTVECGAAESTCTTNADCCSSEGLSCAVVTVSGGSQVSMCVTSTPQICTITCGRIDETNSGKWAAPTNCIEGNATPDVPTCSSMNGNSCLRSKIEQRNSVQCRTTL